MAGYAILTRYAGPTNYRGSRIIARGPSIAHDGPMTRAVVSWDHMLWDSGAEQHRRAAAAVVGKLRAAGMGVTLAPDWYALPDESGYAFTMVYGDPEPRS